MATTDSTPGTPTAASAALPRYVPGALPPVAPSKNQKKKRSSKLKTLAASAHDSALTDHAPDAEDIKAGKVDPALLANPAPASSAGPDTGNNTDAEDIKPSSGEKSVVVEAIAKRVKALGKKVQRVNEYKSQTEKLNEDQKAVVATLPGLEAGIKELEGVKKTIEALENASRRAQNQERAEEQKANEQRVAEAAQHAEAALLPRITSLLSFLALRDLLTHATPTDLSISEPERHAILSAGDVLLAHPPLGHVEEVVKGFLSGAGSWENVDYGRLVEITSQFAAPRPGTPIPDPSIPLDPTDETIEPTVDIPDEIKEEPEVEEEPEFEAEPEVEPEVVADLGLPAHATTGGGFHFMQESELDPSGMSESQEWVAVQPDPVADVAEEDQGEDYGEVAREAEAAQDVVAISNPAGAPLDWAAHDESDDLPSLDSLQAKFGGSGSATPVAQPVAITTAPAPAAAPAPEDDGFSTIHNRRGHGRGGSFGGDRPFRSRGRGRGGFRSDGGEGGEGGGFRGGRGGYRGGGGEGGEGGEGGGYRGRGGYRGDGEGRGGYRGGDGESRGGYRGDGEGGYRGGRGRGFGAGWGQGQEGGRGGRGGYRGGRGEGRGSGFRGGNGGRGAAPGTPTAETAA